ncbi:MAG TPA: non-heme iron oxygenase ferredoxin subunit [Gaiellaceae bacterium]|nr:non-heme iron oxygenase ferredoxin subunit [Gaiellaceae bacterium]
MSEFTPVAQTSELAPGEMKRVLVDRERVLLANVEGRFYALRDNCGHQKAALSKGKLEGKVVECPLHFACFDVTTGKALSGPDLGRRSIPGLETLGPEAMQALQEVGEIIDDVPTDDVPVYEVRVESETVSVRL